MKNTNKNLILSIFVILFILTVGSVFMPTKAEAMYATYHFSEPADLITNLYPTQPIYVPAPVIRYPGTQTNYDTTNTRTYTTQSDTVNNTNRNYTNTTQNTENNNVNTTDTTSSAYKNVAANAFFGKNSFWPSGLIQWVLIAIFILLMVIIFRRVTAKDQKFYSEPLKHS